MDAYRTVRQTGSAEVVIQRSKFLAQCMPVKDAEAVNAHQEAIQKRLWDASHHCYAYILGSDGQTVRFSDAEEPAGTAGMPMLEVLRARSLTNVLVVVTRYFGGILLGAGGLVRAYSRSAAEAVAAAGETEVRMCCRAALELPYELLGKVKYLLQTRGVEQTDAAYGEKVSLEAWISVAEMEEFEKSVIQATDGKVKPQWKQRDYRCAH